MSQQRETTDRRRGVRVDLGGAINAQLAIMADAKVLDLSIHGMRVELPYRPDVGTRHDFVVLLGEHAVRARGTVRGVLPLTDMLNAVGVQFDGLSEEDAEIVERYVAEAPSRGTR